MAELARQAVVKTSRYGELHLQNFLIVFISVATIPETMLRILKPSV